MSNLFRPTYTCCHVITKASGAYIEKWNLYEIELIMAFFYIFPGDLICSATPGFEFVATIVDSSYVQP